MTETPPEAKAETKGPSTPQNPATDASEAPAKEKEKAATSGPTRRTLVIVLAVAVMAAATMLVGHRVFLMRGQSDQQASTSAISIGGPYSLVDQSGQRRTDKDFHGKFVLLYFGYTYCPDICPTTLSDMSSALDQLGDKTDAVTPMFITVDPERDTPEHLKEYAGYFHPRLVALTGTAAEIKEAAKVFRVYYAKAQVTESEPEDYLMDHSSIIYLMGPDGKFVTHFGHGTPPEKMAERILGYL